MRATHWVAACALVLGCEAPGVGGSAAALIGGTFEDDPAIVALEYEDASGRIASCTGAVIAPSAILTAKHCVARVEPDRLRVYVDSRRLEPFGRVVAIEAAGDVERLGTAEHTRNDLAVLYIDGVFDVAPMTLSFEPVAEGAEVELTGYGNSVDTGRERGAERHGHGTVRYADRSRMIVVGEDASTCYGDDGGPLLDAEGRVVGINSAGECRIGSDVSIASIRAHEEMIRRAFSYDRGCATLDLCDNGADENCDGVADDHCVHDYGECTADYDCVNSSCLAGRCQRGCESLCRDGETCFGICRSVGALCGNALPDDDEQCDDGELNGTVLSACGYDCRLDGPRCGDGILAPEIEECDDGGLNGTRSACPLLCRRPSTCGDGRVDDRSCGSVAHESIACILDECPEGDPSCLLRCVETRCNAEACDDGDDNGDYGRCDMRCSGAAPRCGDGVLDSGEACDDGALTGANGYCGLDCQFELPAYPDYPPPAYDAGAYPSRYPAPYEDDDRFDGCACNTGRGRGAGLGWLLALALLVTCRRRV